MPDAGVKSAQLSTRKEVTDNDPRHDPWRGISGSQKKVLTLFGTRPEVIKLAPVINAIEEHSSGVRTLNIASGQHRDLLNPFILQFGIRLDYQLQIMKPNQNPNHVCSRVLELLDPIISQETPDLILVQGDTTTALAGALAGFH